MVNGLDYFLSQLADFKDHFILIGGTACDLWMGSLGLPFRATKDLDIVLVADTLPTTFFERFWAFIQEGRYQSLEQSETKPSLYRFKTPADARHPFMIELFARNVLGVPEGFHLTPIPAGEDISSLSAILLGDDYFRYIVSSRITVGGVPTVPVQCLIPLKARAHLDMVARQQSGVPVDSHDVKKHRNDVFRLYRTLAPADRFELPSPLKNDLAEFLNRLPHDSQDWTSIRAAVEGLPPTESVLSQIRANFGIVGG